MFFNVIEDGKLIKCKIVLAFKDDINDINYVVYEENNNTYASRYVLENGELILKPIEREEEWDLIDKKLMNVGDKNND